MKSSLFASALAAAAAVAPVAHAASLHEVSMEERAELQAASVEQVARAIYASEVMLGKRTAPSGNYAPANITCPQLNTTGNTYQGLVRNASGFDLHVEEKQYVHNHRQARQSDWNTWLKQAQVGLDSDIPGGFDNYTSDLSRIPKVGIAASGGGYRAMLNGAGVYLGLDGRNDTANSIGTGGFLQLADYFSGLSGGSWLLGSVAINDHPTTQQLHDEVWNLDINLVIPSHGKIGYYTGLIHDVDEKKDFVGNGAWTGITDYWARALSHHLINNTMYPDYGINTTWADVRNTSSWQKQQYGFPIIVADEREPGELLITGRSAIWEFTPLEYGTWQRQTNAFIAIDLLGSTLNDGQPENNTCVSGWSNAGWVMGTSSTLFNGAFVELAESQGGGLIKSAVQAILKAIGNDENDVSLIPNSFNGYRKGSSPIADTTNVTNVDGGEDGQNVPIWPLINPGRGLDFLIAEDSSSDVSSWPNGTALRATSQRFNASNGEVFSEYAFPYVPPAATFVNRGLNTRPTFFGCPGSRITNENSSWNHVPSPIVAYLPNYPYTGFGNVSTFTLDYSPEKSQMVIDNAFDVATMGNRTSGDINWPTCLACGSLQRSFERSNTPVPDKCQKCLQLYCWDGVENNTEPSQAYSPPISTPIFITSHGQNQTAPPSTGGNGSASASGGKNPATITLPTSSKAGMAVTLVGVAVAALL